MRIIWDEFNNRFTAELSPGENWREDMEAAKLSGFRTTGPPDWPWYASKASVLNKLRENKPKSGLVLTEVAFQKYKLINDKEQTKLSLRKEFKQAQKKAKKESKDPEISGLRDFIVPEKGYIDSTDLPPLVSTWTFPVFPKPDVYCFVCEAPLYLPFPDYPDICLWCEKIKLDKPVNV